MESLLKNKNEEEIDMLKKLLTPKNLRILSGLVTIMATQIANYVATKQEDERIEKKVTELLEERALGENK